MFEAIDRRRVKAEARAILRGAQVSPAALFAAYLGIRLALSLLNYLLPVGEGPLGSPASLFVSVFSTLISSVLLAGVWLYCSAIRRGERAELLTLFDGFSFAGKVVGVQILTFLFIFLWSMAFVIPGIIAAYRYRYALINICENPDLGALEAIEMSKRQTLGYKGQLFMLDLSFYGWMLLAELPSLAVSFLAGDPTVMAAAYASPWYLLAECVCFFGVSLLYLPRLHVAELAYYETSVRTSGISARGIRVDEDESGF